MVIHRGPDWCKQLRLVALLRSAHMLQPLGVWEAGEGLRDPRLPFRLVQVGTPTPSCVDLLG
jgi:hypothetical protein